MLNRLSLREQVLLFLAIFILILGLYYFYVYVPYQDKITNLKNRKSIKREQIINMKSKILKLPSLEKEYNYRLKNVKERIFISGFSSENLLNKMVKVATETRVNILNYYPKKQKNTISIIMIIKGDYLALVNFLSSLEKWDKQLRFKKLSLKPSDDKIKMEVNFIYYNWEKIGGIEL